MIEIGMTYTAEKTVTPDMTAKAVGSGGLEVFGTPFMMGLMEYAAMQCVQPELPETVREEICGYAGETNTEEIRPTGLRMGLNFLMQKRNGDIVGVTPRGANLDVRRYAITPGGIVRQEDGDTGERLYRRGYRPREDTESEATLRKWRHLEVMSWCDWDAPEE